MAMLLVSVFFLLTGFSQLAASQEPGFISINCGGVGNFTDNSTGLEWISDETYVSVGSVFKINVTSKNQRQYQSLRYFPADNKKYCYKLSTAERLRYLIRATFLYSNFDNVYAYPKFSLYLDTTRWATIMITNATEVYVEEMIFRAATSEVNVCVLDASTGNPFISTLELRPFSDAMYATDFEEDFFLKVTARINFGALTMDPVRYPDDPYDRIWNPDAMRSNYLVGVAPGTVRVMTRKNISANSHEQPPNKVLQTAVVGTRGTLSYRLNLEDFPANAVAYAFFAEIENLKPNETRKFTLQKPYVPGYSNIVLDIKENVGSYSLYEPSYKNVTVPFVLSFAFVKTTDSTRGPLLNAIEIDRYVQRALKTNDQDLKAVIALKSFSPLTDWANESGDPCLPVCWTWVGCNLDSSPRITKVDLSGKNLKGEMPSIFSQMQGLVELKLSNNLLTGHIPDLSALLNLTVLHLENNRLQGPLPSFLAQLPKLQELYVQNNQLKGKISEGLYKKLKIFRYSGNPNLILENSRESQTKMIIGIVVGAAAFIVIVSISAMCFGRSICLKHSPPKDEPLGGHRQNSGSMARDAGAEIAYHFTLAQLEQATLKFTKKIGQGSFGPVYYGKMKDGKEIAVKILATTSSHGTEQFVNEVTLLSRIHHRNLVLLLGYCEEKDQSILVYEYMHNGTLRDHLHGSSSEESPLKWLSRLLIAEDAARGIEYLHSGCNPSIIHRDIKSSNILLDINMRAKVSDFGLSKLVNEEMTHFSTTVRGTVGYLDPEYYATQQLTEKSDVYSFGVVLLELVSGRKPISPQEYGSDWNIVPWARSMLRKGDIHGIIDPKIGDNYRIEAMWKMAEIAILSVEPSGTSRPRMHEVLQCIEEAIHIEKGNMSGQLLGALPPHVTQPSDSSFSLTNSQLMPTPR